MRNRWIGTLITVSLAALLSGRAQADSSAAEVMRIAQLYGISHWDQVEELRYTFHVERGTTIVARSWEWEPKTGRVSYLAKENGKQVTDTYLRGELTKGNATLHQKVDKMFINDEYWLVFPLHLVWDEGMEIRMGGEQPLPIGKGRANKLIVTYPPSGGYTPGDSYEFFYGPLVEWSKSFSEPAKIDPNDWYRTPYIIRQWVYHKGGAAEPTMASTWEGHVQAGPLVISTEHKSGDGKFHLWFSDVTVRLTGQKDFISSKPIPHR